MPGTPGSGVTLNEGFECAHGPLGDTTSYGGTAIQMLAGAALNVGQAVYQSAANTASAGVTANNALRVGVVVGGKATKGRTYPEVKMGQVAAAVAGDWVLVVWTGKVRYVADGVVAVGDKLAFGATAGRLITTATATGVILGIALSVVSGAGVEGDMLVAPS